MAKLKKHIDSKKLSNVRCEGTDILIDGRLGTYTSTWSRKIFGWRLIMDTAASLGNETRRGHIVSSRNPSQGEERAKSLEAVGDRRLEGEDKRFDTIG